MSKVTVVIEGSLLKNYSVKAVGAITKREFRKLSDEAAEVAKNKLTKSGSASLWGTAIAGQGVRTGAFRDSIHGEVHKGMNASVRSVRDEPKISTWIERGTRRGVSLRKGQYQFRAAKTWVEKVIDARLTAALVKGLS